MRGEAIRWYDEVRVSKGDRKKRGIRKRTNDTMINDNANDN